MKYVIGLGKTGISLSRYLLRHNISFIAWDDVSGLQEKAQLMGCSVVAPNKAPWHLIEELILSPGIPINAPAPHAAVKLAKQYRVPFRGDIDFWHQTLQHLSCKFIGITGTNGKSTTHAIIDHIFRSAEVPCFSGGNSGVPVFDANILLPQSIVNLEMSSYQLDTLDKTRFDAGVLLNITPDHLDRYGNIENYILSKQSQIERVKQAGLKVIGIDGVYSQQVYKALLDAGHTDLIPISTVQTLSKGVYTRGDVIYSSESGIEISLGNIPNILPGAHNAQNIMASMLVCRFFGVEPVTFFKYLPLYQGLEHRQEQVLDTAKALFVNDSKATNAEATRSALEAYSHIYWIAGGVAKEEGIAPLRTILGNIDKVLLIGQSAERFKNELQDIADKVIIVDTIANALRVIDADLKELNHKITVLLSPACASQDQFQNFEHRGRIFKEQVHQKFGVI